MTSSRETKAALRIALRARRDGYVRNLADGERVRLEERAATSFVRWLEQSCCVSGYLAIGSEFCCLPVLRAAAAAGLETALPHVTRRDVPMRFLAWSPGDLLEPGPAGLLQPATDAREVLPDLIVTPLLGFDAGLWRIGQGAGFYDRGFAAMPHARRIGVGWSIQQVAEIPRDPWDERLHAIVTEGAVFEGENV
ncbi:5-formyltetrahydrofolate cyclo-ligase [Sphingomonas sp. YR710]|uniref:5-formyltetrahydrofolate cyclo-ligase n=1 Tax=Sphingomonas sp. YR710 TaxID=1882773 RepID=UPI00088C69FB|nr:5-formyltetrahydrofolate cyclo-ligase [Sphingomonas sp. YR710]SDC24549.1 5-formyltetrahydrofolate cyclo-ligase [Sphingomonas sp. YR710]